MHAHALLPLPVAVFRTWKNSFPGSLDALKTQPMEVETTIRTLAIAPRPFAEGAMRLAYHAHDRSFKDQPPRAVVVKEFKRAGEAHNTLDKYMEQMEIQSAAAYLANAFNKATPEGEAKIKFPITRVRDQIESQDQLAYMSDAAPGM
jgi:hypothetical protein